MVSHSAHPFGHAQLSTDLIAPPEIISQLLSAFFAYFYPLHPFPHEQWLLPSYQRREDIGNKSFLALVASMTALVAALRPRQTLHFVANVGYTDVPSFIQRAIKVCKDARGVSGTDDYLENDLNANSAATSYFLALVSANTGDWIQYNRHLVEADCILHAINQTQNEMTAQTGNRVFWAIFVLSR
jgi:hypothetical protein